MSFICVLCYLLLDFWWFSLEELVFNCYLIARVAISMHVYVWRFTVGSSNHGEFIYSGTNTLNASRFFAEVDLNPTIWFWFFMSNQHESSLNICCILSRRKVACLDY